MEAVRHVFYLVEQGLLASVAKWLEPMLAHLTGGALDGAKSTGREACLAHQRHLGLITTSSHAEGRVRIIVARQLSIRPHATSVDDAPGCIAALL